MIKILHSADWHLDAPMQGHDPEQAESLRCQLQQIPEKVARLCVAGCCDMLLLSGDLFDSVPTKESVRAVKAALASLTVPVIITPGNHDYITADSPYVTETWPENVHIFKEPEITALSLPQLNCTVYGAGYTGMDCPGLLKGFRATDDSKWKIGVLHGEIGNTSSNYCPISRHQLQESGLNYLALGHIHKLGSMRAGDTVCAWPGCPMGRGYDELGAKGVILVTLDETVSANFMPLDTPRFYDEEVDVGGDAAGALTQLLPAVECADYYRVTLTGYSNPLNLEELKASFPHIPNLILRDETIPETDLWQNTDADSLEGLLFSNLQQAAQSDSEVLRRRATLAARICRRILDGQEVKLP